MKQQPKAGSIRRWKAVPVTHDLSEQWVAKAQELARPLLVLAGDVADPASVSPKLVTDPRQWVYGNFMLAWLDASSEQRRVCHLPDASFFLRLLAKAYAPVLEARPELAVVLSDNSRPEMSLTNDVLQIQLRGLEDGYSMIRHHALMLFFAALWLDEPRRSQWLELYDALVEHVDERPAGRPSLAELEAVERGAFDDFTALAPLTLQPDSAEELLHSETGLERILDYQLYAGVAIGLLWREYRELSKGDRETWHREQLSTLYRQPDYLTHEWNAR